MKYLILTMLALIGHDLAVAAELEYQGYLRTPVGASSSGGKEVAINNPGSQGNEFRLGNETPYGEASLIAQFLPKDSTVNSHSEFFNSTLTFALNPPFNTQYGDTTNQTDYIQFVQAFIAGGNFDGIEASFWAGKRFYREPEIHMDDFYYFADMSGAGGGVENIKMSSGTLGIALLQYSDQYVTQSLTGLPAKQALDLRWHDLQIGERNFLTLWAVEAYSQAGSGIETSSGANVAVNFASQSGTALGLKWRRHLDGGDNEAAVIFGTGVMENLTLNSDPYSLTNGNGSLNSTSRYRFAESVSKELNPKWGVQAAVVADYLNRTSGTSSRWTSFGVRPIYYFSDHFHLNAQLGYSMVTDTSETSTLNGSVGSRTLTRATLSPEIALGHGIYNRPVIRAYLSVTSWNSANGDLSNSNSLASVVSSQGNYSLKGQLNQTEAGFEGEVWF